jgi:hypothetical protein
MSRIVPRYRVHELKGIPNLHKKCVVNFILCIYICVCMFMYMNVYHIYMCVYGINIYENTPTQPHPTPNNRRGNPPSLMADSALAPDSRFGEVDGGTDIYPDERGVWHVCDEGEMTVGDFCGVLCICVCGVGGCIYIYICVCVYVDPKLPLTHEPPLYTKTHPTTNKTGASWPHGAHGTLRRLRGHGEGPAR